MFKLSRIVSLILALALVVMAVGIVAAQEPAPGEGGVIIQGNTRGSANLGSMLQLRCAGVDCRDSGGLMYPGLTGLDPERLVSVGADEYDGGQLALSWDVSDDGLVYTFHLRQDAYWSDGVQITAADVLFSFLAVENYEDAQLSASYAATARDVASVEMIDDFTIAVTVENPTCTVIENLGIPVDASHVFGWDASMGEDYDWTVYVESPENKEPTVTAGAFKFTRAEPGTAIYLAADTNYYAPTLDAGVLPTGFIFLDVLDDTILTERFLSFQDGEPNLVFEPPASEFEPLRSSEAQYFQVPGTVWHYVSMNTADPTNPQPGLDADGNYIDQGHHPVLGDVRVRQALQAAMNIDEIILGAQNGDATPMVAGTIPSAFSLSPTLERRPEDLDAAGALLDEAGWTDGDGDGIRECHGCLYAEEGTPLHVEIANPGTSGRDDVAVLLQAQWARIGVDAEVATMEFNAFYDYLDTQTFDAAVAGWRGGVPFDPDQRDFFGAFSDIPVTGGEGGGFNSSSLNNPELDALMESVNLVPGCDVEARKQIAYEIQQQLWEQQPYLWLYSIDSAYAAAPNIVNFAPYPSLPRWNMDAWYIQE